MILYSNNNSDILVKSVLIYKMVYYEYMEFSNIYIIDAV